MRRALVAVVLVFAVWCSGRSFGAAQRFIRVSDHCYYLQLKDSGENVAVVVTDDGVLMVNPPQEPELSIAMEALANGDFEIRALGCLYRAWTFAECRHRVFLPRGTRSF